MNADKLVSWKYIIGLSLLISETFYFTLRIQKMLVSDIGYAYVKLSRYNISDIIISVSVLFFFSICFIYLILKINHKTENKIFFFILILLTAFVLAISFKMLFDIADYSWHHVGSRHIYSNIENARAIVRIFWFLIPFLASFVLVFSLRKNVHNIFNFFSIFGFCAFALMSYQIFTLHKLKSSFDKKDKYFNIQTETKKERKVVWIIFDEFDHELAFSNQEHNFELPNFTKLRNNSITHNKMFYPGQDTFYSIPSMLIGEYTQGVTLRNHRYIMKSNDKKEIPFTFENSIFGKINNDGFTFSITGIGFHSYCLIMQVNKCKLFNGPLKWYDGILHLFHVNQIYSFIYLLNKNNSGKGKYRNANPMIIKSMYEFIETPDPTNLLFIHTRVPHLCHKCTDGLAGMAGKHFNTETSKPTEAYFLKIAFIDYLVGEILKKLDTKNYKKDDTLLLLNTDHWARPTATGIFPSRKMDPPNKAYPGLFIAKILGDNQKVEIFEPDSGIHIQELIHKFLKKEISSHLDIKDFFEQKSGYEVFFPSENDPIFIEEM